MNDRLQVLQSNYVAGVVAITDVIKRSGLKLQRNVITKHHTHQGNIRHHCKRRVIFLCAKRYHVSVGRTVLLIKGFVFF